MPVVVMCGWVADIEPPTPPGSSESKLSMTSREVRLGCIVVDENIQVLISSGMTYDLSDVYSKATVINHDGTTFRASHASTNIS